MTNQENETGPQKENKFKSLTHKKKDIKTIQLLLVKELEDIERKLRENLESDDKISI